MATYDTYEVEEPRRHKSHRHHKEPRYAETQETYVRGSAPVNTLSPQAPYTTRQTDIIRQPPRQDSDLSIEEVRREFPPPGYDQQRSMVRENRYGPPARTRSAERGVYGAYYDDPRRSYNDLPRRSRKDEAVAVEEKELDARPRSLSRNQKIISAVGGAALALGSKEIWDRRSAGMDGERSPRNPLSTAAIGAAGAFAGYEGAELYAKHRPKMEEKAKTYMASKGKDGKVAEYYSSDEEAPRKGKTKSKVVTKKVRRGSDESVYSKKEKKSKRSRSMEKSPENKGKVQQAAKAALLAGAYEAFRVRNEPGTWQGEKGKRILTAAIGAGGIDAAADRDPEKHSKRHLLEAVVGGLAGNRLINGSRKEVVQDEATGRSTSRARSRSRARSASRGPGGGSGGGNGGLAALATAGIAGLAGSKLLNRSRSRSRKPSRRDSDDSGYSDDSEPARGSRKRSKSVTDFARKGLAALGIGDAAKGGHDRGYEEETHVYKARRGGSDRGDPYGDDRYADSRSSVGRRPTRQKGREVESESDSDSLVSSSEDERRVKKMKGKQLLTAGLATVATIHAAHNVYQSMEKRDARHKAVAEGEMTPEEARKLKAKATLQDAASVGIAALGIKGAISEIKEANEMRHECKEFNEKKAERHRKRMERIKGNKANGNGNGQSRQRTNGSERYDYGPHYADGNPYAAGLPAPPIDYDRDYDRR